MTDLPEREALQILAEIGWLPGIDAKELLGEADPDPEHESERPRGIEVWRNPYAELRDDPELHAIWDAWRLGYRHKATAREYLALSAFHLECLRELRCAANRALKRRVEPKEPREPKRG